MSLLKIIYFPDERLRKIAKPVMEINEDIHRILDDMFDTLYFEKGIGLAATQVDIHLQLIVIDTSDDHTKKLVLINPQLIENSFEKISINEGCLSIPKQRNVVTRSKKIIIHALDRKGNNFELEAHDLLSICIQHEMDHLVGKLFIDYLSPLKRNRIIKKIKKQERIINRF